MTGPSPKDIKAIADAGGVPVDVEVATRIANSIGPAFEGFEPVSNIAVRSRARDLPAGPDREGVVMSTEPALMSLTAIAKAIAAKQVSSKEVTQSCLHRIAQWQPRLNAFMSIEADAALKAAGEADAELARERAAVRCTACRWRTRTCITTPVMSSPAARRSGAISFRRQRRRRCSASRTPARSVSDHCRWWSSPTARPGTISTTARCIILEVRLHHRRFVVRLGLGRSAHALRRSPRQVPRAGPRGLLVPALQADSPSPRGCLPSSRCASDRGRRR